MMASPHLPPAPFFIGEQVIVPKGTPIWATTAHGPRAIVEWKEQEKRYKAGSEAYPAPSYRLPSKRAWRWYKVIVQPLWSPADLEKLARAKGRKR